MFQWVKREELFYPLTEEAFGRQPLAVEFAERVFTHYDLNGGVFGYLLEWDWGVWEGRAVVSRFNRLEGCPWEESSWPKEHPRGVLDFNLDSALPYLQIEIKPLGWFCDSAPPLNRQNIFLQWWLLHRKTPIPKRDESASIAGFAILAHFSHTPTVSYRVMKRHSDPSTHLILVPQWLQAEGRPREWLDGGQDTDLFQWLRRHADGLNLQTACLATLADSLDAAQFLKLPELPLWASCFARCTQGQFD